MDAKALNSTNVLLSPMRFVGGESNGAIILIGRLQTTTISREQPLKALQQGRYD